MSTTHSDNALTNGAPTASSKPNGSSSKQGSNTPVWQVTPELDVFENATHYLIVLDVPGATAESVDVQVMGTELHVRAEQAPAPGQADVALAAFERHLELPGEVDASSASAKLRDGVLEINVQKSAAARRVRIPVNAN
jgi:HSP20 family protein